MDYPMDITCWTIYICGILSHSVHTFDCSCRRVPLVVTQFTLDKGRNGSHSIICKVTCCLLSLLFFATLSLFVFKCFRQPKNKCTSKDAVKMNCLISVNLTSCISSTAAKQKTHVFKLFFRFFLAFVTFFDTCLTCMCCIKIVNREITWWWLALFNVLWNFHEQSKHNC